MGRPRSAGCERDLGMYETRGKGRNMTQGQKRKRAGKGAVKGGRTTRRKDSMKRFTKGPERERKFTAKSKGKGTKGEWRPGTSLEKGKDNWENTKRRYTNKIKSLIRS